MEIRSTLCWGRVLLRTCKWKMLSVFRIVVSEYGPKSLFQLSQIFPRSRTFDFVKKGFNHKLILTGSSSIKVERQSVAYQKSVIHLFCMFHQKVYLHRTLPVNFIPASVAFFPCSNSYQIQWRKWISLVSHAHAITSRVSLNTNTD